MDKKLNLGIIYRKANTWWNIDYISSVLKNYPKVNPVIIDVTDFQKNSLPTNLDCITLLPHESDFIEDVLELNKNCKWVHCMWSGVDKFLNKESIKSTKKNIALTNGRGAFSKSLAEYSMFSMLYFSYNLPTYLETFKKRGWERPLNQLINGKTLTIVGYGWNGVEIAKKAKLGFDMKVIGIKRNLNVIDGKEYIDEITTLDKLTEVIPRTDFLLNILPQTSETEDLYDEKLFSLMKKSAVFINLGRGASVKEEDLIAALKEKRIFGAALDVFKQEPLSPDSEFYDLDNVLLSFHSADNTDEYFKQGVEVLLNNLDNLDKTGNYLTYVDKSKGY